MWLINKILYPLLFLSIFVFPNTGRGEETTRSPFSFIAIGDVPYTDNLEFQEFVDIDKISQGIRESDARFVVHVGDYMGPVYFGTNPAQQCLEKYDQIAIDLFRSLKKPVILTPGDNEWSDCEDPMARLDTVRKKFFESPDFKTIDDITHQSTVSRKYKDFIENSTWSINGIRFVTIHVVGGSNNRPLSGYRWEHVNTLFDKVTRTLFKGTVFADTIFKDFFSAESLGFGDMEEFIQREQANIEWLQHALSMAIKNDASALVIMNHSNEPGRGPRHLREGTEKIIEKVRAIAREFKKPILWIQGNEHGFRIDRPFTNLTTMLTSSPDGPFGEEVNLVTRVIIPGFPLSSFVTVDVDFNTADIFNISVKFPPAIKSGATPQKP